MCGRGECAGRKSHSNLAAHGKIDWQFAPSSSDLSTPPSPDPFGLHSQTFNGYHLLNEVSTGGTLSSLFSILSLFTEDIKLSWTPNNEAEDDHIPDERPTGIPRTRSNSDVSRLSFSVVDEHLPIHEFGPSAPEALQDTLRGRSRRIKQDEIETLSEGRSSSLPSSKTDPSETVSQISNGLASTERHPSPVSQHPPPKYEEPQPHIARSVDPIGSSSKAHSGPMNQSNALDGTIARAVTETTLAFIPAEAFRKLTRKFPKASGTIVQVVLERFSRVTFMTGEGDRRGVVVG